MIYSSLQLFTMRGMFKMKLIIMTIKIEIDLICSRDTCVLFCEGGNVGRKILRLLCVFKNKWMMLRGFSFYCSGNFSP